MVESGAVTLQFRARFLVRWLALSRSACGVDSRPKLDSGALVSHGTAQQRARPGGRRNALLVGVADRACGRAWLDRFWAADEALFPGTSPCVSPVVLFLSPFLLPSPSFLVFPLPSSRIFWRTHGALT